MDPLKILKQMMPTASTGGAVRADSRAEYEAYVQRVTDAGNQPVSYADYLKGKR